MSNAKPRTIEVATRLNPAGQPKLLFTIDKTKLTFKNENHPGFAVTFTLNDTDKNGYVFPANPLDAMWCQPIEAAGPDACPTSEVYWDGFAATLVDPNRLGLHVSNPNGPLNGKLEQLFGFVLRVTKTPEVQSPQCEPLDPIGTNKNGPLLQKFSATTLIVALVVAVAVAVIGYQLLKG